jgi:hypothetical protein
MTLMRYGRRFGTAPTRFRITSLNRHSGGAPAGGGTFRGNSGRGIRTEFFSDTDEPETLILQRADTGAARFPI